MRPKVQEAYPADRVFKIDAMVCRAHGFPVRGFSFPAAFRSVAIRCAFHPLPARRTKAATAFRPVLRLYRKEPT